MFNYTKKTFDSKKKNIKYKFMFGGGYRRVAKCLQESVLIVFDLWKVCLSDMNFATLLDPAPMTCLNKENKSLILGFYSVNLPVC